MMTVLRQLLARVCRKARTIPLVNRVVGKIFQEYYQLPFPPTHYYSPLPDLPSVKGKSEAVVQAKRVARH